MQPEVLNSEVVEREDARLNFNIEISTISLMRARTHVGTRTVLLYVRDMLISEPGTQEA